MKSIYRNKASVQWCTKKYLLYTSAVGPKRWQSDGCGHSCGKVRTSDRPQISNSYVQSWTKITDRKFRPRSPPNQGWENYFWPLYGFILDWGMRGWEWGFLFHFFLCKIVAECFCHLEYWYCNLCFVFLSQSCLVIIDLETHTQWIRRISRGFLYIVIGGLMLKVS